MSVRFMEKRRKRKDMATTRIEVNGEVLGVLVQGLNHYKPKTDDQWFTAAEIREIFQKHMGEGVADDRGTIRTPITIKPGEKAALDFEGAQWRLVQDAFQQARAADVYHPAQAQFVVAAMRAVKEAKELPPKT